MGVFVDFLIPETVTDANGNVVAGEDTTGAGAAAAGLEKTGFTDIAVHSSYPILACSREEDRAGVVGHSVRFYMDEGEEVSDSNLERSCRAAVIKWHPHRKILAVGWEDGTLTVWNEYEKLLHENKDVHRRPITCLEWYTEGNRFFTGDAEGCVAIWKCDGRGQMAPMKQYKKSGSVTSCVFRSLNIKLDKAAAGVVPPLFFGGENGLVYLADDIGFCEEVFKMASPIEALLFHEGRDIIIAITKNMTLAQYSIGADGQCSQLMQVKLSGGTNLTAAMWAGPGILATASCESSIRVWDFDRDENYILRLIGQAEFSSGDRVNCISYNPTLGILAGGTNTGHVVMWQYAPGVQDSSEGEEKWTFLPPCGVQGNVNKIAWGARILCSLSSAGVRILNEQIMNKHFNENVAAIQRSASRVTVQRAGVSSDIDISVEMRIKGLFATKTHVILWNGKQVEVYETPIQAGVVRKISTFPCESDTIAANEDSIVVLDKNQVHICSFQGNVKQSLHFSENEGKPCCMSVLNDRLVCGTTLGYIKVWIATANEMKLEGSPMFVGDQSEDFGEIKSVKVNCAGSFVSFIISQGRGEPDSNIFVWDLENDVVHKYNLKNSQRLPVSHFWDFEEPRLLAVEASKTISGRSSGESNNTEIFSFFVSSENSIMLQDSFGMESLAEELLGVSVPFFFFSKKTIEGASEEISGKREVLLLTKTMRDFVGLEKCDEKSQKAMINFSFNLTTGNLDEAFKSIKLIKSDSVWESMARMCVKTQRLDVASVCLGNMGHARGARALRELPEDATQETRVAVLAIQLGMLSEAEKLLQNGKEYATLTEFYEASGQWDKAIEVCTKHNRIGLRKTHYNYAKYLENIGKIPEAIKEYEKSETHRFEVPRMFLDNIQDLEKYISGKDDKKLLKWWARYCESIGDMETALKFYNASEDYLSVARVYAYCGNLEKALDVVNVTGDRAAAYHIARQYENMDDIKTAISYFSKAQCNSHAFRLAKENDMEDMLANLALLSTKEVMLEAAEYYERKPGMVDKAVLLYHKGGRVTKALDMCFQNNQYEALRSIADDLDENTDKDLLDKCSAFFIEHNQHDKAVKLLLIGGKYGEALQRCSECNVIVTEELAEKFTLPKGGNDRENEFRIRLLEKVAEICEQQKSYHLACKKYTQAGDKLRAMRALLRSGDTEKIVFFAGVSRQRDVYIMAANYLQSLDWRRDPETMKNIISFYTKARALDSLAGFYDACAQVEIDEYQNYEKAFGALKEAFKCMSKAKMKDPADKETKLASLQQKIELVDKFVQVRRLAESDAEEMMKQCYILLEEPSIDNAVRIGDIYGLMIEYMGSQGNHQQAHALLQQMKIRIPSVNVEYYIDERTLANMFEALGISGEEFGVGSHRGGADAAGGGDSESDDDEIAEDLSRFKD
eukprot:Nk52_evm9s327 gene=Nk52_evmTU9s327